MSNDAPLDTTDPCRWRPFASLPRAHGPVPIRARLRHSAADFIVDEQLAFGPDGDGEHVLLRVRKTDANTEWTARRLAHLAGVDGRAVGYAGLKDRHAVTTQWFSVHLPGAAEPNWEQLTVDGIEVLEHHRHRRKLRRGILAGNRFELLLREVTGDTAALAARCALIEECGVPNYFGPQRFGRDQGNLYRADALFRQAAVPAADQRPARVDRHLRGLWLSAARSQLFNEVLAWRQDQRAWCHALTGERLQLFGSHSHFLADQIDESIHQRVESGDLQITGPLFGEGPPLTSGTVAEWEQRVADAFPDWVAGLARSGLKQERRALRLDPEGLTCEQPAPGQVRLCFTLPAGSYATTLLRELADWWE